MKTLLAGIIVLAGLGATAQTVKAADLMVASAMQRCTSNEECTLVTNSCADNCGFVPVNKMNLQSLQGTYQQRCGKPMEANPACNINPPIAAACINSRCTIDYAYAQHAGAKDYKSGAYPVPEAPVPSQAPVNAAPANDRQGFTAYDLPQGTVHQNTMGQIVDKVYVPASAPVTGGNYVPVTQQQTQSTASQPQATAPVAPTTQPRAPEAGVAPYAPTQGSYATPTTVIQPPVAPRAAEQMPAGQPRRVAPAVAAPQPAPVPTATTTPETIATPANPIPSAATDAIPEPRAPDAAPIVRAPSPDTGNPNAPVPPSDFKEQRLVPPPGATIPVGPNDPGAVPPPNVVLQPPVPDKQEDGAKSFSITTDKQDENFN